MWNCVMLSCLVSHHVCETVSCYPVWLDNINMNYYMPSFIPHYPFSPVYHTMSILSITFLVYQPFELESVMAVSKGVTTRSSEKIVLPVDADRTTVVLAQEPAPPYITQTLADCTPTQLDREPATPLLTPTPADSNPVPVDTAPSPPQSTQTWAVSKGTAVPKARGPPLQIPIQRLKEKKICSQVRFCSYGSYSFALALLYLLIPTIFNFEGWNWNSNGTTGMF